MQWRADCQHPVRQNAAPIVNRQQRVPSMHTAFKQSARLCSCTDCSQYTLCDLGRNASTLLPNDAQKVISDGADTELHGKGVICISCCIVLCLDRWRESACAGGQQLCSWVSCTRAATWRHQAAGLTISVGSTRMPTMRSRTSDPAMTRTCEPDKDLITPFVSSNGQS